MAQTTLTYLDAAGSTQTLEATTGSAQKIPNTRICDALANFMPPMDVVSRKGFVLITDGTDSCAIEATNAAVSETTVTSIRTIASLFAIDAAAGAGSQQVPCNVVSSAQPWLKVALYNGTTAMPAMAAVGSKGFVLITDGTDSCAIEATNAAVSESTVTSIRCISSLFGYDSGAGAGSRQVPLAVATGTNTLLVQACNSTNLTPAGDAVSRCIFHKISDGTSVATVTAASTAAVATDLGLVVSPHPTSPVAIAASGGGTAGAAGTAGTKSLIVGGVFTAYGSLPAATTTQQVGAQFDQTGTLKTAVAPMGTPIYGTADSGGAAAANVTLTIPAAKMGYLDGFDIDGLGATAGSAIAVTVTGLLGGTLTIRYGVPAGATVPVRSSYRFNPPLQASAVATNIVVNVPSFGAGNTASSTQAYGHYV